MKLQAGIAPERRVVPLHVTFHLSGVSSVAAQPFRLIRIELVDCREELAAILREVLGPPRFEGINDGGHIRRPETVDDVPRDRAGRHDHLDAVFGNCQVVENDADGLALAEPVARSFVVTSGGA